MTTSLFWVRTVLIIEIDKKIYDKLNRGEGSHLKLSPFFTIIFRKESSFGTRESLSSYVFFKMNLYVRAYTWRKNFCQLGFSHNVCPLNIR